MRTSRNDVLPKRIAFLKNVPPFTDLSEESLETLVNDFRPREYERGEIIFHQEDNSRELYVVVKGKVRIFKTSPSGNETSICVFSTHAIIGEFSAIDHQPRSATAKAVTRCTLLAIAGDKFLQCMRELPDLGVEMSRVLVSKLRWTAAYAEAVAQYDAAARLLHILLLYNAQFGEEKEAGKQYVLDLSMNQTDLASLVGVSREWINRKLMEWRGKELLEYKAGKITILDLPAMERARDLRIETYTGDTQW
jgi:CRP/FNR family transcriptional regulator